MLVIWVITMHKDILELAVASYPTAYIDDFLTQIVNSPILMYSR